MPRHETESPRPGPAPEAGARRTPTTTHAETDGNGTTEATPDLDDIAREAAQRLAAVDQRLTAARRDLLAVFCRAGRPLSVQEAIDATDSRVPTSSAYRSIAALVDAGVLARLNFDEGFVRYELNDAFTAHHHHLVCEECQNVIDLDDDALAAVEAALADTSATIAARHGFSVHAHQIDLFGRCADCIRRTSGAGA